MPDFRRFVKQFQRFGSALLGYAIDVFRYDWKFASWTIGTSMAGIGLQAASLGAVLVVARSYEDAIRQGGDPTVSVPLLPELHPSYALIAIVVLLAASVLLLYEAQRAMYALSVRFANWRASALLREYPLVAERIEHVGVEGPSGVPVGLRGELSSRATALNRTGRTLFGGGTALMQFVYGVVFLLYIQPIVMLAVLAVAMPLIVPLRWSTRIVNEAEKARRSLTGNARAELEAVVREEGGAVPGSPAWHRRMAAQYSRMKVARNNEFILRRFVGMARSKAVANTGLTLTFAVSIGIFFGVYGPGEVSISSMLVFFVALRVASMGGRQLTSRVSRFARFYRPVRTYLLAYHQGRRRRFPSEATLIAKAPPADGRRALTTRELERGVPFGVFSAFPVVPMNMHVIAVFTTRGTSLARGDLFAGMTCAPGEPRIGEGDTWRDWLPVGSRDDAERLFRRAAQECPGGIAPPPGTDPGEPVLSGARSGQDATAGADLALLGAWASAAEIVVVPATLIDRLGPERWAEWCQALNTRYLAVHYRAGEGPPCRAGEAWAVLVDFAGSAVALAGADWLRANSDGARERVSTGAEAAPDAYAGDEDDDEDED